MSTIYCRGCQEQQNLEGNLYAKTADQELGSILHKKIYFTSINYAISNL